MAKSKPVPRIFCLEGDWHSDYQKRDTVRPLLEFLDHHKRINSILRDVATIEELIFYLKKWQQKRYQLYSIGYFAFHGVEGAIYVGRKLLDLQELGEVMKNQCRGRILYFGSCSTLRTSTRELRSFLDLTKARCICGYTEDVDWMSSAAFELLLFDALTHYTRRDGIENFLKKYRGLRKELGFKMVWRDRRA